MMRDGDRIDHMLSFTRRCMASESCLETTGCGGGGGGGTGGTLFCAGASGFAVSRDGFAAMEMLYLCRWFRIEMFFSMVRAPAR